MSKKVGTIGWTDLTVPDAEAIRDFYSDVVGWKTLPVGMGEYDDFNMTNPETSEPVVGVCHKRGTNADLPSQWMIYINVENLDKSVARCTELGGKIIVASKNMGSMGRYCVIEDPAGAVSALFEPAD